MLEKSQPELPLHDDLEIGMFFIEQISWHNFFTSCIFLKNIIS